MKRILFFTFLFNIICFFNGVSCDVFVENGYPSITSPRCGVNNGSIKIVAKGLGKVKYSLNGSAFQESGSFKGLGAGQYTINMVDEAGCKGMFTTTLESLTGVSIDNIETQNSECDKNTGSITVYATGEGLRYRLNNGALQTSNQFNGLAGGNYTVVVVDALECEEIKKVTISQGSITLKGISKQGASCVNKNGSITINAISKNRLKYKLLGITKWQNKNQFNNLEPGNYTLLIKESTGCELKRTVVIANEFRLNVKIQNPSCGEEDGNVEVLASPEGIYKYSIDQGKTWNQTGLFKKLQKGNYTVMVEGVNNDCSSKRNFTLQEEKIKIPDLKIQSSPTSCSQSDGKITVFTETSDFIYKLFFQGKLFSENKTGEFINLKEGKYSIKLFTQNNCESDSYNANIGIENDIKIGSHKIDSPNCNSSIGSITLNAKSNKGLKLTYSIDGINFTEDPAFRNLEIGSHQFTIKSESNCSKVIKLFLSENNSISFTKLNTEPPTTDCSKDGQIVAFANSDDVQFSLDNINYQKSNVFNNLGSGKYTIYIKNSLGCIRQSGTINFLGLITIEEIQTKDDKCNESQGNATINAKGENLVFSLDGKTFQKENKFTNLPQGEYKVYVSDGSDCTLDKEFTINNIGNAEIETVQVETTSCGLSNGKAIISYLDEGGDYKFKLNDGEYQAEPTFSNLAGGKYRATIKSVDNCEDTFEFEVPKSFPIEANINKTLVCNKPPATFKVVATGGVGKLQYSIDNNAFSPNSTFENLTLGIHTIQIKDQVGCLLEGSIQVGKTKIETVEVTPKSCKNSNPKFEVKFKDFGGQYQFKIDEETFQDSPIFNAVSPGKHTITIKDQFGCKSTFDTEMPETFPLSANIQENLTFCIENKTYPFEITANGGVGQLKFSYNDNEFSTQKKYDLSSGTHYFKVKDEAGCILEGEVKVGHAKIDNLIVKTTSCGLNNGEVNLSIEDFGDDYSFSLNNAPFTKEKEFKNLVPGEYTITVQGLYGCKDSRSFTIYESYPITHTMDDLYEWCSFQDGEIIVNAQGGVGTLRYALNNNDYSNNNRFTNVPDGKNTIYIIDDVGCTVKHTLTIGTDCKASFPSAITPNGNGKNDSFKLLYYKPLFIHKLSVYDRWGGLVHKAANFESTDTSQWWKPCIADSISSSYAVYVEYDLEGETRFYKGLVQVIY